MLSKVVWIPAVCFLALPMTGTAFETVQGPFRLDKAVVQPEVDGICLQYNSSSETASKPTVDVGLVGYGVEAYRSLKGEVKVLDRTTTTTLWTQKVAPTLKNLSFIEAKESPTRGNIILLRVGGDRGKARYFEIRTGHEKYLMRDKQGLLAVDEYKQELRGQPLDTMMSMSGIDSHIKIGMCLRVCNLDEWRTIWRNHSNTTEEPPEVDFKNAVVIAVFIGETWNCKGLALQQIIETDDTIEVFVRTDDFQSMEGKGNHPNPFGFYVLPKIDKPLLVKRDIQDFVSGAPRWTLIEKFEP